MNGPSKNEPNRLELSAQPGSAAANDQRLQAALAEHERTERDLQQRLEQLRIIYELSNAVTKAEAIEQIYREALDGIQRALRTDRIAILLIDADNVMRFKAWRGLSDGYRALVEGHSPWALDARDPQPVLIPDVEAEPSLDSLRDGVMSEGIRAIGFIPLVCNGRLLGKFMIYYDAPHQFTRGEAELAQTVAHHITFAIERKRAEDERADLLAREQRAREEAERANRFKDEFIAILSHELRTPLNCVLGWCHILDEEFRDDAQSSRSIQIIRRSAEAMQKLVNDLMDVSSIMAGKLRLEARPIDLTQLVSLAVESLRPAAVAKGVAIHLDLTPSLSLTGDADRLQQVVWNLLSNAIKFTPGGGHVRVRLNQSGERCLLEVRDTGAGIDAEMLPHIFERFRQADSRVDKKHLGLGLGLTIARHIVEMHAGEIEAHSAGDQQGATFIVRLPLAAS